MKKTYANLNDLPRNIQDWLREYWEKDAEDWIFEPVPALGNRSVIETINSEGDGEAELRRYISKVKGYFS